MSYNKTFNNLQVKGRIWILTKSPKMVCCLPHLKEMGETCLPRKNENRSQSPVHEESDSVREVRLNLQFSNMHLAHMFGTPRPKGTVGATLYMFKVPHPLEKGEWYLAQASEQWRPQAPKEWAWKNSSTIFPNRRGNIPMHSLGSRGAYLLPRSTWLTKPQRVDECHEGWDGLDGKK